MDSPAGPELLQKQFMFHVEFLSNPNVCQFMLKPILPLGSVFRSGLKSGFIPNVLISARPIDASVIDSRFFSMF